VREMLPETAPEPDDVAQQVITAAGGLSLPPKGSDTDGE
jgi:predicted flavoprotein YhiN